MGRKSKAAKKSEDLLESPITKLFKNKAKEFEADIPAALEPTPAKPPEGLRNSINNNSKSLIDETFEKFGINTFLNSKQGDTDDVQAEETPEKKTASQFLNRIPDYNFLLSRTLVFPDNFFDEF